MNVPCAGTLVETSTLMMRLGLERSVCIFSPKVTGSSGQFVSIILVWR